MSSIDVHRYLHVCVVEGDIVRNKERPTQDNLVTVVAEGLTAVEIDFAIIFDGNCVVLTRNRKDLISELNLKVFHDNFAAFYIGVIKVVIIAEVNLWIGLFEFFRKS